MGFGQIPTVFAVNGDSDDQDVLCSLAQSGGYRCKCFKNARSFLDSYQPEMSGCVILELRIPDINGIDLFYELRNRGIMIPVIFLTGFGDVHSAVSALKLGAIDYLEKPCDPELLQERIEHAIAQDRQVRLKQSQIQQTEKRIAQLSHGELEVMARIVAGEPNKKMALALDVTERTIENRRASLVKKLEANSIVDVIRMALTHERELDSLRQRQFASHQTHSAHTNEDARPAPHLARKQNVSDLDSAT